MFHSYVDVYQRVNLELVKNAEFTHENGEQWRFTHEIYTGSSPIDSTVKRGDREYITLWLCQT